MTFDVSGRSAIVTGSAQGLGKQYAIHLLKEGAKVCISDVDVKLGEQTLAELGGKFGKDKVIFVKCDVTQEDDMRQLWEQAEAKLGPISILVNNAGVNFRASWQRSLDIMLSGVVIGTVLAREKMAKNKGGQGGRIINTASVAGLLSMPNSLHECMGYQMAKWGVVGLTRNFQSAIPNIYDTEGIKCYAMCPWYTNTNLVTDQIDIKKLEQKSKIRVMEPEEVGRALIDAIKLDCNGAVLLMMPDAPLLNMPNFNWFMFYALAILGKIMALFNVKMATINPHLLLAGSILAIAFLMYVASCFLSCLLF